MTLDQPEAGEWELDLQSEADNAYLLMTDFETAAGNGLMMHATKKDATPSQDLQLDYQLDVDGEKIDEESLTTTYHVVESGQQEDTNTWSACTPGYRFQWFARAWLIRIEVRSISMYPRG